MSALSCAAVSLGSQPKQRKHNIESMLSSKKKYEIDNDDYKRNDNGIKTEYSMFHNTKKSKQHLYNHS